MRTAIRSRSHAARVAFALGVVWVVWGSTYLAIRVAVETLPPIASAGVRFLIAGAILYAIVIRRTPPEDRPTRAHWRSAAIVGGALLVGGNGGVVVAESWGVPSGITALLVGTVPLWMALIGRVFYDETLSPAALGGVVAGFAGVAFLARPSGDVPVAGSLLLVGAALSWAAGSLWARTAPLPRNPFLATALEMIAGGALQVVVGVARGELSGFDAAAVSRSSLLALLYLITVGSFAGFTAYIWTLHNARTSLVSTYAYVNPVIAVVLGALIVSEPITARDVVAGAAIVGSVALIIAAQPRRERDV